MPALPSVLDYIARGRRGDPLAPATVIVPSHIAGIQLRRRLASEHGAFAGVRFETLPRLAELLGAGDLARGGLAPLARPIGDYLAAQIAREARSDLADVRDLGGFARVLRQTFRRLRRGGFRRSEEVPVGLDTGLLGEVVRLYGRFRQASGRFYDEEDLLEAAASALDGRRVAMASEMGDVYVLPPGALSTGSDRLLTALKRAVGTSHYKSVDEPTASPETHFVLAPDPSSEVREVARGVLRALEAGCGLHEVAVFYGADPGYRTLLHQEFESARIPISPMPGTPLSETVAGRAVLALAELPLHRYSRVLTIDCLSLAPLKPSIPSADGPIAAQPTTWRRLAREAGVTQGSDRWASGLSSLIADLEAQVSASEEDERRARYEQALVRARDLDAVIKGLMSRLEPLVAPQPASTFIAGFRKAVNDYLRPDAPAMPEVLAQIDQLGTIDAVGGNFTLESFAASLRANLDVAFRRESSLGDGVLIADYRLAAGLSFKQAVICGAYEGIYPPAPPPEPLVEDRIWSELRRGHGFLEDAMLRSQRSLQQARTAANAATDRLTWTAPLQAAGAGREHYPSRSMLSAAQQRNSELTSASELRRAPQAAWLRRPPSPLASHLTGTVLDIPELRIRRGLIARRTGAGIADDQPLARPLRLLQERRSARFSEFDGNLSTVAAEDLVPRGTVYPTSIENYGQCGFRYYLAYVLRLRPPEEPEDRETIDPRDRGNIVHEALQQFFKGQAERGRPALNEAWNEADRQELLALLDSKLDEAQARGRIGLEVFAEHDRHRLRADLSAFLEEDSAFRQENGCQPVGFEIPIPETAVSGLLLRGFVDRVDRTPDQKQAWVIDYKTGNASSYKGIKADDPLAGGTKLQLPVYMAAVRDAETIVPLYWFISSAANFERIEFPVSPENLQRFDRTLAAILDGIKRGAFPAVPGEIDTRRGGWENCRYCDFDRLCSRRRDDELVEKQGHSDLAPWSRIAGVAAGAEP